MFTASLVAAAAAAGALSAAPSGTAEVPFGEAAAALAFEERLDGRCHNLSEGGKLVVLVNRDPRRAVRYRLRRLFAGRPQGGLSVGTIAAGAERKLGCSRVDGREQRWVIERAHWEQPQESTP